MYVIMTEERVIREIRIGQAAGYYLLNLLRNDENLSIEKIKLSHQTNIIIVSHFHQSIYYRAVGSFKQRSALEIQ